MITKINLKNFKVFKEGEFDLAPLTLITGINGMGKSSIIQSLLLLKQSYEIEYLQQSQKKVDLKNDFINLETAEDLCYGMAADDDKKVEIGLTINKHDIHKWIIDASNQKGKILDCLYSGSNNLSSLSLFSQDFIFLDAERLGPRESNDKKVSRAKNTKLGVQGELTPAYLYNAIAEIEQIGIKELMHRNLQKSSELTGDSTELSANLSEWMSEIMSLPLKTKVTELDESRLKLSYNIEGAKGKSYSALQVGFGLTFSLPIVVAALRAKKGDLLIIENPEAHLHPGAQSKIGKLLALLSKYGVQVIIETHSEHIINGVRLCLLEKEISPENVIINFFSSKIENEVYKPYNNKIKITSEGELTEWPKSFFDQSELDFIELLKLKVNK